jgi:hypothetical protein
MFLHVCRLRKVTAEQHCASSASLASSVIRLIRLNKYDSLDDSFRLLFFKIPFFFEKTSLLFSSTWTKLSFGIAAEAVISCYY